MGKTHRIKSANDNSPRYARRVGQRGIARPQRLAASRPAFATAARGTPTTYYSTKPTQLPRQSLKTVAPSKLKEIALLLTMIALTAAIVIFAASQDIMLTLFDILALDSIIGLLFYAGSRSLMPIMFSLFGSACWAGLSILPLFQGQALTPPAWGAIIPLIALGQLWAATDLRSRRSFVIAGVLAAVWCALLAFHAALPAAALGSLIFMLGVAQHRLGKAAKDRDHFGADAHSLIGWIIAIAGAAMVQYHWLDFEPHANLTDGRLSALWIWGVGLCALAILVSSLMRYRAHKISALGIFIVSAVSLILPFSVSRPDIIDQVFAEIPGLSAVPSFGLVIGAAIIASAIGMIVNGLRRNQFAFVILGAIVFGLQGLLIFQPVMASFDFAVIAVLSLIGALAIGGLVAGRSLSDA
ncbi:hypothetical protein ACJ3XI_04910 [Litorimonas sp. RW-G-Af-16]|uniref:hypothetical protein n=1 Tax=Litorimonas sp. RW-G-Af-16 TaxID=3241168 RepID=UPI00390C780E